MIEPFVLPAFEFQILYKERNHRIHDFYDLARLESAEEFHAWAMYNISKMFPEEYKKINGSQLKETAKPTVTKPEVAKSEVAKPDTVIEGQLELSGVNKAVQQHKDKIDRFDFNCNPIHMPITQNIMHNFTIAIWFRTNQINSGICAVYDKELAGCGSTHDRHLFLKDGRPHVRTMKGGAWASAADLKLNDDKWHHFS